MKKIVNCGLFKHTSELQCVCLTVIKMLLQHISKCQFSKLCLTGMVNLREESRLVQTPLWLTVAHCRFNSKLQPDVEQNRPEIKTAYKARRFKAKQDSWPTVTRHVRWWNHDSLLQTLHSTSCCAYIPHQDDPLWPATSLLLISTRVTSSLLHWVWSPALSGLLMRR